MTDKTPFLAGQAAYKAGEPMSANPHKPGAAFAIDQYPGDYANWRAGWRVAKGLACEGVKP